MRSRPGAAAQSSSAPSLAPSLYGGRTTRLRFSAAAAARSSARSPGAPHRSIALTSMCAASQGATSAVRPVSTLITPPGTSEVASTSDSDTAGSGQRSLASTTAVLPLTTAGATTETKPSRLDACGAITATTPVGSGSEKLKYGPATGLAAPRTWASLYDQPAYQTQRSMAASTTASACRPVSPSAPRTSATN